MRTDQITKTDWQNIEDAIKPLIKRTLGLPLNAAKENLYGARDDGFFGISLAAEDLDIALIDGGGLNYSLVKTILSRMLRAWS